MTPKNKNKNRIAIFTCILCLIAGLPFTACGENTTRVVFTTGFGKDEVFRIDNSVCKKSEMMVYLTTIQQQY